MAEPFKNQINQTLIEEVASCFDQNAADFDRNQFVEIASDQLEYRELKDRCMQIVAAMEGTFPTDFPKAADIIEASLHPEETRDGFKDSKVTANGIQGWAIMAVQEYVGRNGLEHVELSLKLLKLMTKRLTSEFGIRYFLDAFPLETLREMQVWVKDPSEHVRRLVSEGTRTRLPWGMRLNRFIADPSPVIPLLECLKDDPSEYVRRSVANNLNDLAKDHPDMVCKMASHWWVGADINRQRLIRHALRTLIKKGKPEALAVIGYGAVEIAVTEMTLSPTEVNVGGKLEMQLTLKSKVAHPQSLLIDYAVHFVKANGKRSAKVFKWTTKELQGKGSMTLVKRHSFVPVTTRKYYPGTHMIEIMVNGSSVKKREFVLQ